MSCTHTDGFGNSSCVCVNCGECRFCVAALRADLEAAKRAREMYDRRAQDLEAALSASRKEARELAEQVREYASYFSIRHGLADKVLARPDDEGPTLDRDAIRDEALDDAAGLCDPQFVPDTAWEIGYFDGCQESAQKIRAAKTG